MSKLDESQSLVLQPWGDSDKNPFAALAANPKVMRYIGDRKPWARDRVDEIFQRQHHHWEQYGFGWRSATEKATSRWIGFVGLNHVEPDATEIAQDEVEIGWWFDPSVWNRRLATEGAIALRDEGFERIGLNRIIGRYQPENMASERIMETLGMAFEREAVGRHGDTVRIYALNRDEWLRVSNVTP
jgi:ribosomal-protein-alanine N-acetyltransferase